VARSLTGIADPGRAPSCQGARQGEEDQELPYPPGLLHQKRGEGLRGPRGCPKVGAQGGIEHGEVCHPWPLRCTDRRHTTNRGSPWNVVFSHKPPLAAELVIQVTGAGARFPRRHGDCASITWSLSKWVRVGRNGRFCGKTQGRSEYLFHGLRPAWAFLGRVSLMTSMSHRSRLPSTARVRSLIR
jgi:hypothetical protein